MVASGTVFGAFTGKISNISDALLGGGGEAIELSVTLFGVVSFWSGLMKIAVKSGLIDKIQEKIAPLITKLFPTVPVEHEARKYISMNIVANFLGLGVAATPAGLKAMEALGRLQDEKTGRHVEKMSNAMCTFLVVNISSIQLIPITVIAYRANYGSSGPAEIIVPGIIATTASTFFGILFAKIMEKKS